MDKVQQDRAQLMRDHNLTEGMLRVNAPKTTGLKLEHLYPGKKLVLAYLKSSKGTWMISTQMAAARQTRDRS